MSNVDSANTETTNTETTKKRGIAKGTVLGPRGVRPPEFGDIIPVGIDDTHVNLLTPPKGTLAVSNTEEEGMKRLSVPIILTEENHRKVNAVASAMGWPGSAPTMLAHMVNTVFIPDLLVRGEWVETERKKAEEEGRTLRAKSQEKEIERAKEILRKAGLLPALIAELANAAGVKLDS